MSNMYSVKLSMPATVVITVALHADSQEEAIVAGYDKAYAALPKDVTVVSVHNQAATLDSCIVSYESLAGIPAVVDKEEAEKPQYFVQAFDTPEQLADASKEPRTLPFATFAEALAECNSSQEPREYLRQVVDVFGNKLAKNYYQLGQYVVVAFDTKQDYDTRLKGTYDVVKGWIPDLKTAKKEAMALLETNPLYAVGVLDATQLVATVGENTKRLPVIKVVFTQGTI